MKLAATFLLFSALCLAQNPGTNATMINGAKVPPTHPCVGTNAAGQIIPATCIGTLPTTAEPISNPGTSQPYSYVQGATGSVGRTQTNKNQDVVSVKDFGAVGNGTTDDHIAIQKALDALQNKGGTVLFPLSTGCYMSSVQITLNGDAYSNITLSGVGYGSCVKALNLIDNHASACGHGFICFRGTTNYSQVNTGIVGLRVSGFSETAGINFMSLVSFGNTSNSFVLNSFGDTNLSEGFYWNSPLDSTGAIVSGNYVTRVGGYSATSGQPLAAYNINVNQVSLIGNQAFQVGECVEQTGDGGVIANNICNSMQYNALPQKGIALESTSAATYGHLSVTGNSITNCNDGINFAANYGGNLVSNNNIYSCNAGITINNRTKSDQVSGNTFLDTISGSQGAAISAQGTAGGIISGNTITQGTTQWAYAVNIVDTTGTYVVKSNTTVGDPATSAIYNAADTAHVEFIHNKISGATIAARTAYKYLAAAFTQSNTAGIWSEDTILSANQRSVTTAAAIPTIGTWALGDIVYSNAPASGGNIGWTCTASGTPGTWVAFGPVGLLSAGVVTVGGAGQPGDIRSYQDAISYVSLLTNTSVNKSGLYRSSTTDWFAYYDTGTGDTVLNNTFGGSSGIKFNLSGTTKAALLSTGVLQATSGGFQVSGTSTDPVCTAVGDVGKFWTDTTTTTTALKFCKNVAGVFSWSSIVLP